MRSVAPGPAAVAPHLAPEGRWRAAQPARDRANAFAMALPVGDGEPLCFREMPGAAGLGFDQLHRGIVQALPGGIDDRRPIPPPGARLAANPNQPARLRVID